MNVLMLSTDRTILDASSPARKRMEEYATALGKLSVIVMCQGKQTPEIGAALSLYPTNSSWKFSRISDAVCIAKKIGKADVITAQDPFETGLAGKKIARALRAPLHVQVHTDFLAPGFASAHWPLNAIRFLIAPRVLRYAAHIRVVSDRIKKHIEEKYHPAVVISVLPIFSDVQKYIGIAKTHHPKFKTTLLVVSRLEKEKRIELAIKALKAARSAGVECGLVVVGSGSEENNLKKQTKDLGIPEWVEFAGFQNNLIPYYAMADVLLYPGAPYEGYGMAIVEALSAGVPVLASDVGVAREAGASIVEEDFNEAVVAFLRKTPMSGKLLFTPYQSKEEYVRKFVEDLSLTLKK